MHNKTVNKNHLAEIDMIKNGFFAVFPQNMQLEKMITGFRFVEGPIWIDSSQTLLFSDIPGNALYMWTKTSGLKLFRENSYLANGNALDIEGNLITCEHGTSRLTKTNFKTGSYSVLASFFDGNQLNSPNDVICKSDGNIYFTDPIPGRQARVGIPRPIEQKYRGIFKYDDKTAFLHLLDGSFTTPNGLCFSPDEKQLFVNDSSNGEIYSFCVDAKGLLCNKSLWGKISGDGAGCVDGMKCLPDGHILCSGPGGIYLLNQSGYILGRIKIPEVAANFTFAKNYTELYITATTSIYKICL